MWSAHPTEVMMSTKIRKLAAAVLVLSFCQRTVTGDALGGMVQFQVVNNAGALIELFWLQDAEPRMVKQTVNPLRNGTDAWASFSSVLSCSISKIN